MNEWIYGIVNVKRNVLSWILIISLFICILFCCNARMYWRNKKCNSHWQNNKKKFASNWLTHSIDFGIECSEKKMCDEPFHLFASWTSKLHNTRERESIFCWLWNEWIQQIKFIGYRHSKTRFQCDSMPFIPQMLKSFNLIFKKWIRHSQVNCITFDQTTFAQSFVIHLNSMWNEINNWHIEKQNEFFFFLKKVQITNHLLIYTHSKIKPPQI